MPIRPENRARYPKEWRAIRAAVLERAGNACEGSPLYPECRAKNHEPHPETGALVILTIAHLDHTPENCQLDNLRAWCQRCHNAYDAPTRAANIKRRKEMTGTTENMEPPEIDWLTQPPLTDNELETARQILSECLATRPGENSLRILNLSDSFRATYGIRLVSEAMQWRRAMNTRVVGRSSE